MMLLQSIVQTLIGLALSLIISCSPQLTGYTNNIISYNLNISEPEIALASQNTGNNSQSSSGNNNSGVTLGGKQIEGWTPDEMVGTSNVATPEEVTIRLNEALKRFVQTILPLLAVISVGIIVYNAIRNIFVKEEDKHPLGGVIKNIFIGFFFIIFAWMIVEAIIFVIQMGGGFAQYVLYGG